MAPEPSEITVGIWKNMLRDVKDHSFVLAVEDYCRNGGRFQPTLSEIRKKAMRFQNNEPSAQEAWIRIWNWFNDKSFELTAREKKCIRLMGGEWALRNSRNPNGDKHDFYIIYDGDLCEKPIENKAFLLREENKSEEKEYYSAEKTRELCRSVIENIENKSK